MLRRLALMLHEQGVPYNFQSDWNFLVAVSMYDNETVMANTNGKNIVRWIKEDLGFQVDPHAHETTYNYADVAYLISSLGVEPSNVAGGFISDPPEDSVFDHFLEPIHGWHYDYTWQAEILWGASTYLHQNEVSGVWRPKDRYHFYEHDPSTPLINIARYIGSPAGVLDLVQRIERGEAPPGKMYTCCLFVAQAQCTPDFIQQLEQEILALKDLEQQGKIVWATLQQVAQIWQTQYHEDPNIYIVPPPSPSPSLVSAAPVEEALLSPASRGGSGFPLLRPESTMLEGMEAPAGPSLDEGRGAP